MNSPLKRAAGLVTGIVGAVGTALAVAAIVAVWNAAYRLEQNLPEAFGQAAAVLESINNQSTATVEILDAARRRVSAIQEPLRELSERDASGANAASLLQTLYAQIARRLETAEELTVSMRNSMRSMTSALLLLDSLPFFASRLAPEGKTPAQWRAIAKSLTDAADQLDQVANSLANIREGQAISPRQLEQIQVMLGDVDHQLVLVRSDIYAFSQTLESMRSQLDALAERVEVWIYWASGALTAFPVCFGFSQISLLLHGWQWLRKWEA